MSTEQERWELKSDTGAFEQISIDPKNTLEISYLIQRLRNMADQNKDPYNAVRVRMWKFSE